MNKVAQYLHSHMAGEVTTHQSSREQAANDGSVLTIVPEMVAYPRLTNDIRKATRFAWQLAEKGHVLPVITRGGGTGKTGGAIGKGLVLSLPAHMNQIFEYDAKQKLIRLQPGVKVRELQNALSLHGMAIPVLRWYHPEATLGGIIASSRQTLECIDQLEVVLSNGDVLQTKRLSKREVSKKKGQSGFEGDIYRDLDAFIDESQHLLNDMQASDGRLDNAGYRSLLDVKNKDGSINLAPLMTASQGTLGVISEMILRASYVDQTHSVLALAFTDVQEARDAIDTIGETNPVSLEYIDASYVEIAREAGKTFSFYEEAKSASDVDVVLVVTYNDFNHRHRAKKIKKVIKAMKRYQVSSAFDEDADTSELAALTDVVANYLNSDAPQTSAPPLADGVYLPLNRFEEFRGAVAALAKKQHVSLPLYGRPLEGLWFTRPLLKLNGVGDKQKVLRIMSDYANLVSQYSGVLCGIEAEGRLQTVTTSPSDGEETHALWVKLKSIFDPYGIMNTGAKQPGDMRNIAGQLRSEYHPPHAPDYLNRY